MPGLFSQANLGRLVAPNRIVRSATHEGMADSTGHPRPELLQLLKELARGGTGTIISGHAFVLPEGRASRWQLGLAEDAQLAGVRQMAAAVHSSPTARFILQLAHAGARADIPLLDLPAKGPSIGACGVADAPAMDEEDIARTIAGFVSAAKRAQQAGCDGVQIHAAHGYLLSTFLSPLFNRRTDDWGGSTARRARIVLDIVSGIRHVTGDQFPILIKMNAADFVDGGLQPSEMIEIAGMLEQAGLDAVEMSGGTPLSGKQNPIRVGDDSVWYRDAAEQFKKKLALPLILVGGIRRASSAEDLLNQGICDAVALSRPLIRQPDLPDIWRNDTARNADCISCNRCMVPMRNGQGLYCPLLAKAKV